MIEYSTLLEVSFARRFNLYRQLECRGLVARLPEFDL